MGLAKFTATRTLARVNRLLESALPPMTLMPSTIMPSLVPCALIGPQPAPSIPSMSSRQIYPAICRQNYIMCTVQAGAGVPMHSRGRMSGGNCGVCRYASAKLAALREAIHPEGLEHLGGPI
jgi:hypothetical protein